MSKTSEGRRKYATAALKKLLGARRGHDRVIAILDKHDKQRNRLILVECTLCKMQVEIPANVFRHERKKGSQRKCVGCCQLAFKQATIAPAVLTDLQSQSVMQAAREAVYRTVKKPVADRIVDDCVSEAM